jgi:hypothetical protein
MLLLSSRLSSVGRAALAYLDGASAPEQAALQCGSIFAPLRNALRELQRRESRIGVGLCVFSSILLVVELVVELAVEKRLQD